MFVILNSAAYQAYQARQGLPGKIGCSLREPFWNRKIIPKLFRA